MSAGILSKVSFGLESTWGTAVTPNKALAVHPGNGIQTNIDTQFISQIKGQLAKNSFAFKGKSSHEGEYEFDFIPGNVGYILKSLFGGLSSALKGGESVVYEHTFSEAAAKPSLTIEQAVDQIVRRYAGSIVTSLKLNSKVGEALTGNASIKAKTHASASAVTPANETVRPFNFADMIQASGFKIGSNYFDEVESLEFEYKNNGEMIHTMGSNDPSFFDPKASEVMGKFDLYMSSDSAPKYTDFLNQTQQSLQLVWQGDTIGVSSNYKLDITIHKVVFKASTYPISDKENVISVEWEGIYDTSAAKLLTAILTNLTANYN